MQLPQRGAGQEFNSCPSLLGEDPSLCSGGASPTLPEGEGEKDPTERVPPVVREFNWREFDEEKYYYDEEEVERRIRFVEKSIKLFEGQFAGRMMKLMEWQKERIWRPVFGVKRKSDGLRRFRMVFLFVPRKNMKTGADIALILTMLLIDGEKGAEINAVANSREQLQDIFRGLEVIIQANPKMRRAITCGRKTFTYHRTNSVIRVLPSKASSLDGLKSHMAIYEEAHECQDGEVWTKLKTSTSTRRQPLLLMVTTAGVWDDEQLACQEYTYAKGVANGEILDDTYLPILYETKPEDPIDSEETWRKANPCYGVTVTADYLGPLVERARHDKVVEAMVRRYHLNQWLNVEDIWIPREVWLGCDVEFSEEALLGRTCYAGLDMSSRTDLTALSLVFPLQAWEVEGEGASGRPYYAVLPFFWIPAENIARKAKKDVAPYGLWLRQYPHSVFATEGNEVSHREVLNTIDNLRHRYKIKNLRFDRWNIGDINHQVQRMGITPVEMGQGYKDMSEACKSFHGVVLDRHLIHFGNLVLLHQIQNVIVVMDDAENIKTSKRRATGRIDGIQSTIMGLDGAVRSLNEEHVIKAGGVLVV